MQGNVLNIDKTNELIQTINAKLIRDFKYSISIDGYDELYEELNCVWDCDVDGFRELNKAALLWHTYFVEVIGVLYVVLEQYKNVDDIYKYLNSICVVDQDLFAITAPKYKIDTTNIPYAIKELESKSSALTETIKEIKILENTLTSYDKFVVANYYRTSKIIRSIVRRERNVSFTA